jgi:hypothetical protein
MKPRTVDLITWARGSTSGLRAAIVAAFVVGALASLAAPGCSSESDTNATCKPNVTSDGIVQMDDGCDTFAACIIDGKKQDPSACCAGLDGSDLAQCLYGYGAGVPMGTGGGGTGGTTGSGTAGGGTGGNSGTAGTAGGKGTSGGGGGT